MITFEDIEAARDRIKGAVFYSPCPPSIPLSEITGMEIFCKLDNLQRTGSFKERGARNALAQLSADQKKRGVIAASAGNHAQALAYQGKLLCIPATVVMPKFAPLIKVNNCEELGANVVLHGKDFAEAKARAHEIAKEKGLAYIDGYDDPAIIAGQGTMGLEMIDQVPDADAVIVPVGGAGLLAGVSLAVKTLRPETAIIAVEAENVASFSAALEAGKPTKIALHPTLADGLAIPQVGTNGFEIAQSRVDRTVTVTEEQIAISILRMVELEKGVVEGAAATPLAACLSGKLKEFAGKRVVLLLSGGNIDPNVLSRVIERGLVADGRLCRFTAIISDRPGGLADLATRIASNGANIKQVVHDRAFGSSDVSAVHVRCTVETRNHQHLAELRAELKSHGVETYDTK
ncbi:MAG: threonine ammonia-lyase [Verrucomicrobia bacterium]|nr:MAG: threonine ammonia-lyase [Verrucomicrobiota bacterium]PYK92403.1 MAG: threonine ammonia-lyase [Verrucomicrobiota bacterium]